MKAKGRLNQMGNGTMIERSRWEFIKLGLKGFWMGAADVVPGVSGGTMALITGIYEELIQSIKSIDFRVLRLLITFQVRDAFKIIPWKFLASVLFGIVLAILTLARGISWLLEHTPVHLWSFFFGLVMASVLSVGKQIKSWNLKSCLAAVLAMLGAYLVVGVVPIETTNAVWFIFASGVIAICAMILPGISGSFILVLLGKYQFILAAVNDRNFLTLMVFTSGAAIGILSFAQILSWVYRHHHDLTVAMLTGLMVGSLRKIWPWKATLATMLNRHGKEVPIEQINVLPEGLSLQVGLAIGLAAFGFVIVLGFEKLASKPPQEIRG